MQISSNITIDLNLLAPSDFSSHKINRRKDGRMSLRLRGSDPDAAAIVSEPALEFTIADDSGIPLDIMSLTFKDGGVPHVLFYAVENPGTTREKYGDKVVIGLDHGKFSEGIRQFREAPWSQRLQLLGY